MQALWESSSQSIQLLPRDGSATSNIKDILKGEGFVLIRIQGKTRRKTIEQYMDSLLIDEESAAALVDNTAYLINAGDKATATKLKDYFVKTCAEATIVEGFPAETVRKTLRKK